jgi:hypothetical protein
MRKAARELGRVLGRTVADQGGLLRSGVTAAGVTNSAGDGGFLEAGMVGRFRSVTGLELEEPEARERRPACRG